MEFYNQTNHRYFNVINRPITHWRIKVELLDHYENTIDAIERDLDNSNSGSVSCNNEQGSRKTCSLTLTNLEEKYTPDENNPFWFNRKFRLYIGVVDNENEDDYSLNYDTYWFAKGVFIAESVSCDSINRTVSISAVDKYAQLDGTLNVLQADEMNTVFEQGSSVEKVINDILMLDIGNGFPLDPIEPIVDTDIAQQTLYKEYTLSAGQYYGDFLNELATSFGCEIFYDNIGRLTLRRSFTDDVAYWNAFKAPSHEFEYSQQGYMSPQETAKLNGVNKIIVQTENVESPNASYTAINHNPQSPLCYDKIGGRTLPENGGIITINAGDLDQDNRTAEYMVMKRCKDYAEYRLMKETCTALEVSFNCPMYPHINEGDIVTITDKDFKLDHDTFIVNSISFNFGDLTTQIQVVNTQYLNTDINAAVDVIARGINKPVTIEYKIVGGTGVFPSPTELPAGTVTFITTSGYDTENHFITFYKDDAHPEYYETTTWVNTFDGSTCPVGYETYNPGFDSILFPIWENVEDKILRIEVKDCNEGTLSLRTIDRAANSQTKRREVLERVKAGTRYYYYYGRGQQNDVVTIPTDGDLVLEHVLIDYPEVGGSYYDPVISNIIDIITQCSSSVNSGVGYSVKLPDVLTSCFEFIRHNMSGLRYTSITFGNQMTTLGAYSFLNGCSNLETVDFNNDNELTIRYDASSYYNMLSSCPELFSLSANNVIKLERLSGSHKLIFGDSSPLPAIHFPCGFRIEHSDFFKGCATNNSVSVSLGLRYVKEDSYCYIYDSDVFCSVNAVNAAFRFNNIQLDQGNLFNNGAKIKSLTIDGYVNMVSTASNASSFFVGSSITGSSITDSTISVDDHFYIAFGGTAFAGSNGFTQLNFKNYVDYQYSSSVSSSLWFIVGCANLTTIRFYGRVDLGSDTNESITFICGNPALTDVYFYNSTFVIPSTAGAFAGNNANLTIHGIPNSAVQSFAESKGIPFVAITDVELAEAGL